MTKRKRKDREKKKSRSLLCSHTIIFFLTSSRRSLFHFSVLSFFIHSITYIFHYSWRPVFYHYYNNKKMRCNLSYHHWVDLLYFFSLLLEEETIIYYSLFLTIRTLLKISYTIRSLFLLHYIHIIIHVNAFCKSSLAS